MKMSKVSPERIKKAKEKLLHKWNTQVACNKPSADKIRAHKRAIRRMKRDRHEIVDGQVEAIKEQQAQDAIVREYLEGSGET